MPVDPETRNRKNVPLGEKLGPALTLSLPLWAFGIVISAAAITVADEYTPYIISVAVITLATAAGLTFWGVQFGARDV